ncbi:MAG: hypothetical protein LBL65_02080 [Campylobacteraceae bacterium]|jgi:hypothetical protein|nr:hypothetical protein [Campylobacteraceae bacterium]
MRKIKAILILLPALFLAGCCVDEYGNVTIGKCEVKAVIQCNGDSCGNSLNSYTGTGNDVWSYKNSGNSNVNLTVSMANIADKEITIVYTNEGSGYVTMPSIYIDKTFKNEIYPYEGIFNYLPDAVIDFEPDELIEQSDDLKLNQAPSYKVWNEGNKYNWRIHSCCGGGTRTSTLRKQLTVNGRTINLWVEDSEYANGGMDTARINYIASYINDIYTNVVSVAGEPWGAHKYLTLISSNQPLDIVFYNTGGSVGGYFTSANNYVSKSNEALVIFIHTRMDNGYTLATIAHELTHAINFYQRYVLMGSGSDNKYKSFLEEMTAVMMEDVISSNISYNAVKNRYGNWLSTPLYHCSFGSEECSVYDMGGSFGSFLMRQYGIDFYKTLLRTSGSSTDALDKAIKVYDDGGLVKALRNWGASIAMFSTAPKGFGYPARSNDNGFSLEAFDGNTYRQYRKLPVSSPATLAPNAHFPFLRKPTTNTYSEWFVVPKGVGVSIVVK